MWALILAAAFIHLCWMNAPEALVGVTFIGLGSLAGLALPEVWIHAGAVPGALMLAGGLIYVAGALSYHRRRPDPSPAVFGYHEVFHACVCAAATCQYLSITLIAARTVGAGSCSRLGPSRQDRLRKRSVPEGILDLLPGLPAAGPALAGSGP